VYDIETEGNISGTRPSVLFRKDSESVLKDFNLINTMKIT